MGLGFEGIDLADRQTQALAADIHFEHHYLDLVPQREDLARVANAAIGDLRDMHQPAHAFGQFDERAKILQPIDLARDDRANCELLFDLLPRVLFPAP